MSQSSPHHASHHASHHDGAQESPAQATGSPVDRIKAEVERAKQTASEVRSEVSAALEARRGGAPGSPDEASDRLREQRDALSRDLQALRTRTPDPSQISQRTRRGAIAAGGGVAATVAAVVLGGLVRQRRKARRSADAEVERQAEALARALTRLHDRAATDPDAGRSDAGEGERSRLARTTKLVLALALAVGSAVVYRLRTAEPPEVFGPGAIDPIEGPPADAA